MTPYLELPPISHVFCAVFVLLMMTAALFLLATVFTLRLRGRCLLLAVLLTSAVLFVMQGISGVSQSLFLHWESPSFSTNLIGKMPYVMLTALLVLLAAAEAAFLVFLHQKRKTLLPPGVIKETLDALPAGVCFFSADGQPLLLNTQIERISGNLTGTGILNAEHFWSALKSRAEEDGSPCSDTMLICREQSGRVWDIRRNMLTVGSDQFFELVAHDVTVQYRLIQELENRNRQLNEVNQRLHLFSRQMEYVIREKEVLAAKVRVHDDVGRSLLAFRAYLAQPRTERDREKMLFLWKRAVTLMRSEASPEEGSDSWDQLLWEAQRLNVAVSREGHLPKSERDRNILLSALRECVANTAKHAGGDLVCLAIAETDTAITAEITNSGQPPQGEIRETGGLKNIRIAAETFNVVMAVESTPRFLLRLTFQKGERPVWEK